MNMTNEQMKKEARGFITVGVDKQNRLYSIGVVLDLGNCTVEFYAETNEHDPREAAELKLFYDTLQTHYSADYVVQYSDGSCSTSVEIGKAMNHSIHMKSDLATVSDVLGEWLSLYEIEDWWVTSVQEYRTIVENLGVLFIGPNIYDIATLMVYNEDGDITNKFAVLYSHEVTALEGNTLYAARVLHGLYSKYRNMKLLNQNG